MRIIEWINDHPGAAFRILLFIEGPEALTDDGSLYLCGDDERVTVFDSADEADLPFDLAFQPVTAAIEAEDGVTELEYISGDLP